MPTTIVSPAQPDKLVVNGCDLVNREELSESQNRELQRYIDANAHLLGFLDKEKDEADKKEKAESVRRYNSNSLGRTPVSSALDDSSLYRRPPSITQSLHRAESPYSLGGSEYGGKRKGVSWSDVVEEPPGGRPSPTRVRSHSPPPVSFHHPIGVYPDSGVGSKATINGYNSIPRGDTTPTTYSERYQSPYEREYWSSGNPWSSSLDHHLRTGSKERERKDWKGFAKPDLPTYSTLDRPRDDFNPFQTHIHREESIGLRKSQERDDTIKFHAYGDHKVSGIEMKPKGWTGGEIVTDPNIMQKSLKPRRLFYSPIGDGVVAADGIEMKRPPPDLTPRRYVYHQRYVEQDPGQPGVRVTEKIWHEGDLGDGSDGDDKRVGPPFLDEGLGGPQKRGPVDDGMRGPSRGDDGRGKGPRDDDLPILDKFPLDGLGNLGKGISDDDGRGRPVSAMSTDSGVPREGWTIKFIANPRELINQYGTETLTTIFDLDDHTPKMYTTEKVTYSPAPPDLLEEEKENGK